MCIGTGVETCSNGMDGKEGSGVCCPSGCTQCGGDGCSSAGDEAGLTESDCCQEAILQSNVFCEDTDSAPCILGMLFRAIQSSQKQVPVQ